MSRRDPGAASDMQTYRPARHCLCGESELLHGLINGRRAGCSSSTCRANCRRFIAAPREWTPDVRTETGTRVHLKRACNGCGGLLGDVTDDEIERAIAGLPAEDVTGECPRCTPRIAEAVSG